jgi:hypothetical protein
VAFLMLAARDVELFLRQSPRALAFCIGLAGWLKSRPLMRPVRENPDCKAGEVD